MFIIFIQDRQGGIEKQLNLINDDIKKVLPVSLRFSKGLPVREINEIKRSYIEAELVLSSTKNSIKQFIRIVKQPMISCLIRLI